MPIDASLHLSATLRGQVRMVARSLPTNNLSRQVGLHPAGLSWDSRRIPDGAGLFMHSCIADTHHSSLCVAALSYPAKCLHARQNLIRTHLKSSCCPQVPQAVSGASESQEMRPFVKPYACHPAPAGLCPVSQDLALGLAPTGRDASPVSTRLVPGPCRQQYKQYSQTTIR